EALDDLHLAHFHREERAGLALHDGGVLDDVQRETRLPKARAAGDEDEVGRLKSTRLLVDRLDPGANSDPKIAACVDLLRIAAERDVERNDVAVERRFAHREEQLLRVLDGGGRILAGERETRDLVRDADKPSEERGALDDRGVT